MLIKSLSVPRDLSTGSTLKFNVTMVQILVVSPQTTNIKDFGNPAVSSKKGKLGEQGTDPNGFKDGVAKLESQVASFSPTTPGSVVNALPH